MTAYTDPMDLADALADEITAQHAAMLERCDITIIELDLPAPHCDGLVRHYGVYQGVDCLDLFTDDDEARAFAVEQAREQIEQELV